MTGFSVLSSSPVFYYSVYFSSLIGIHFELQGNVSLQHFSPLSAVQSSCRDDVFSSSKANKPPPRTRRGPKNLEKRLLTANPRDLVDIIPDI